MQPTPPMHPKGGAIEFILTGFKQSLNIRHYFFQVTALDRTKYEVSVDADLDLMRRYGISIQEMPLLCRRLLEGRPGTKPSELVVFSEQTMSAFAHDRTAERLAQELRRKRPIKPVVRRPGNSNFGGGAPGSQKAPPRAF